MSVLRWTTLLVLAAALIGGLGYFKFTEITTAIAEAETHPEHSESVEALETAGTRFVPQYSVPGEVVVADRVTLRSELPGRITQVGFQPGGMVEAGQLLVQIDIAEEQARLRGARAEAELARIDLERAEKLLASGNANRARVEKSQAALDMALSSLGVIEEAIARKTITAPFAGVTNPAELVAGQYLNAGDAVAELTGLDGDIWVDFRLPQFQSGLESGAELEVTLPGGELLSGRLAARNAEVTAASRTRLFRLLVEEAPAGIAHGGFAEVRVPAGPEQDVIDIPLAALQSDGYGQYVHVLEPDEASGAYRAVRRDVGALYYQGSRVLVAEGLETGLTIASKGAFKLYPGVLTYVVDELAEDPAAQAGW